MKATNENTFLLAQVAYKGSKYYIVKKNKETAYIAKDRAFVDRWHSRPKGVTWKKFCEQNDAIMVKYHELEITKEEADKKEEIEAEREREANKQKLIPDIMKKQLADSFKRIEKKSKKTFRYKIEHGSDAIFPVAANKEKKIILFHGIDGSLTNLWAFYFIDQDDFIKFDRKEHYKDKKIQWPDFEAQKA